MSYAAVEIQGLIENYMAVREHYNRSFFLVRSLDLQAAMNSIPYPLREAVFYLGVAQLTTREASELLGVPRGRLSERYRWAIDELLVRLN